jgi:anthranilate/para-aminobenzoate synthase component II
MAMRYHSLILPEETIKPPLKVSAYTLDGEVMGLRLEGYRVEGVQFHPESIGTAQGMQVLHNFLTRYVHPGQRIAPSLMTPQAAGVAAQLA